MGYYDLLLFLKSLSPKVSSSRSRCKLQAFGLRFGERCRRFGRTSLGCHMAALRCGCGQFAGGVGPLSVDYALKMRLKLLLASLRLIAGELVARLIIPAMAHDRRCTLNPTFQFPCTLYINPTDRSKPDNTQT